MTSLYLASRTTPTISMSSGSSPAPVFMRLPTAPVPRPNLSTKRSLTIATFGRSAPPTALETRARDQRHLHGSEEVGAHVVDRDVGVFAGSRGVALDADVVTPVVVGEKRHCGGRRARDARNLRELLHEPLEEHARALRRIAVAVRRDREHGQRIGPESEVDARDVGQALREPPREHEQRHRKRDLRRRQRRAKTRGALAARRPHALRLQRGVRLEAHELQRRDQAEHERRDDGETHGHLDHARAQARVERRLRERRQQRAHAAQRDQRQRQAREHSAGREQQHFDEQQTEQPVPRGAERGARGDLADARRAAREQQVRDVHARDQQHETRRDEQDRQRRPRIEVDHALPALAGLQAPESWREIRSSSAR